jgi:hypothetical protein
MINHVLANYSSVRRIDKRLVKFNLHICEIWLFVESLCRGTTQE